MNIYKDQRFLKEVKELSKKLNIPENVILNAHRGYYKFIKEKLEELPLKEDLTDESLDSMVKSINVSSLGKFFIDIDKYKRKKEIYKQYLNNVKAKED